MTPRKALPFLASVKDITHGGYYVSCFGYVKVDIHRFEESRKIRTVAISLLHNTEGPEIVRYRTTIYVPQKEGNVISQQVPMPGGIWSKKLPNLRVAGYDVIPKLCPKPRKRKSNAQIPGVNLRPLQQRMASGLRTLKGCMINIRRIINANYSDHESHKELCFLNSIEAHMTNRIKQEYEDRKNALANRN